MFNKSFVLVAFVLGSSVVACTFNTNNTYEFPVPPSASSTVPSASATTAPTETPPVVTPKPGSARIVDYDQDGHASRIVIGGKDAWQRFTGYMLCAGPEEDVTLTSVTVATGLIPGMTMDNADFTAVGIVSYGEVLGSNILPAGTTGKTRIDLGKGIWAPKNGACTPFEIVAKVSAVQASSTVAGATSGVCRSGHAPALGINADSATTLEVAVTGKTSGAKISISTGDAHMGKPMVIRKSMPIVTTLPLSSTTLVNGVDMDFFKLKISVDDAGSISWKKKDVIISKTADLCITDVRVRRGSTDLDPATYTFVSGSSVSSGSMMGLLRFQFVDGIESTETGSGNVYTFHGVTCGVKTGSTMTTSLSPTDYTLGTSGLSVDVTGQYAVSSFDTGTFIWSDLSEVPHSAQLFSRGGTADWTNSFLVNLGGLVTLSN